MTKNDVMERVGDILNPKSLFVNVEIWGDYDEFGYVTEVVNSCVVTWYYLYQEDDGYIALRKICSSTRGEAEKAQAAYEARRGMEDVEIC